MEKKMGKKLSIIFIFLIVLIFALVFLKLGFFGNFTGKVVDATNYGPDIVPLGFDPGLNIKRAVSQLSPSSAFYSEFCPREINGRCYGNIPAGSGFYTLANDASGCAINGGNNGSLYDADSNNLGVLCPFYFNWRTKQDKNIAYLKVDTLNFKNISTRNIYFGLQENVAGSVEYFGIDFNNLTQAPYIDQLEYINFSFRAKLCSSPKEQDSHRFGRVITYFGWWNSQKGAGQQVSSDLLQFWKPLEQKPTALVSDISSQAELGGCGSSCSLDDLNSFYLNGKNWGFLSKDADFFYDISSTCNVSINSAPWIEVSIPVKSVIQQLSNQGIINQTILNNSRYVGSIVLGIESWGRNLVEAEIKDRTIYGKKPILVCDSFNYSKWGACNSSSLKTRTIVSSFPDGCVGGSAILTKNCTYVVGPENIVINEFYSGDELQKENKTNLSVINSLRPYKEKVGFFRKLWCGIINLFSSKGYNNCISNYTVN